MEESYFVTELPKKHCNENLIDWGGIPIDSTIRFVYRGSEYEVIILDSFIKEGKRRFVVSLVKDDGVYNEWDKVEMYASNFGRFKFGNLVSTKLHDWLESHNNNLAFDLERNNEEFGTTYEDYRRITYAVRRKYYFKCKKCGLSAPKAVYQVTKKTKNGNGVGCPICDASGARVVERGNNDIATTHPELIHYFANIEDAYSHSKGSNRYVDFVCPDCGETKNMLIPNFIKYGLCCPSCSDNFPYGEKFMFNFLKQTGIPFEKEYSPSWIAPHRYDFYIPSLNLIIETDGGQHKQQRIGWRGVEVEKKIDEMKDKLAKENGIKLIRIDTKRGIGDYIKNEILESELASIFDLSKIDFVQCGINASRSYIYKAAMLVKNGYSISEISEEFKVSKATVKRWKKQARFNKWI